MHNHPSGDSKPSARDITITQKVKEICKLIDKPLIDHIVFGVGNFYTFANEGTL